MTFDLDKTTNVFRRNAKAKTRFVFNPGGTRCFHPDTLVVTKNSNKKISEIVEGDEVLSFGKEDEFKKVKSVFKLDNTKPTVKIKLKNGEEIICTDDHKFYFKGEWVCIKHLLSLWNENNSKL